MSEARCCWPSKQDAESAPQPAHGVGRVPPGPPQDQGSLKPSSIQHHPWARTVSQQTRTAPKPPLKCPAGAALRSSQTGALKRDDQRELVIFFFFPLLKLLSFSISFYDLQLRLCVTQGSTAGGAGE